MTPLRRRALVLLATVGAALFAATCGGPERFLDVEAGALGDVNDSLPVEAAGEGDRCGFLSGNAPYVPCEDGLVCLDSNQCWRPTPECGDGVCRIPASSLLMDFAHEATFDSSDANLRVVPTTPVIVSKPFVLMQSDVTYKQWKDVMGFEHHPKHYGNCGKDCPIIGITFWSILRFANCLSARDGLDPCYTLNSCLSEPDCVTSFDASKFVCDEAVVAANSCSGYRLPSVAEWELATRAGTNACLPNRDPAQVPGSCYEYDPLALVAWFCGNSFVDWEGCADCVGFQGSEEEDCCGPHPVGQLEANAFGIKDALGNVVHILGTLADSVKPEVSSSNLLLDPGQPTAYARWSLGVDQPCSFNAPSSSCCLNIRSTVFIDYVQNGPVGFRLARTAK